MTTRIVSTLLLLCLCVASIHCTGTLPTMEGLPCASAEECGGALQCIGNICISSAPTEPREEPPSEGTQDDKEPTTTEESIPDPTTEPPAEPTTEPLAEPAAEPFVETIHTEPPDHSEFIEEEPPPVDYVDAGVPDISLDGGPTDSVAPETKEPTFDSRPPDSTPPQTLSRTQMVGLLTLDFHQMVDLLTLDSLLKVADLTLDFHLTVVVSHLMAALQSSLSLESSMARRRPKMVVPESPIQTIFFISSKNLQIDEVSYRKKRCKEG